MQVTVEDGYIADIAVLSFQDDREFFQKAQSAVINDILAEQTSDVDAVSGATFSSNGIMDAVADALGSGTGESEQPADNGRDDAAGGENGSEPGQQEADGESGPVQDNRELARETAPEPGIRARADMEKAGAEAPAGVDIGEFDESR